ncbi:hypothetical protein CYMTET_50693 [Cymbomonas tetramitiformis]|nr:hypothetical protein CYMTET_50693 [Cymbomonas tetramitiformis]
MSAITPGDGFGASQGTPQCPATYVTQDYVITLCIEWSHIKSAIGGQKFLLQPEKIRRILLKDPKDRHVTDVTTVSEMANSSSFFGTLNRKRQKYLCQFGRYTSLRKGELLYLQGDEVAGAEGSFYLVVSGSICLCVLPNSLPDLDQVLAFDPEKTSVSAVFGPRASLLSSGAGFGELSLISGLPRIGSAVANEYTQLMVVSRDVFEDSITEEEKQEAKDKMHFIEAHAPHIIQNYPKHGLAALFYRLERRSIPAKTVICREGKPLDGLGFLASGEVRSQPSDGIPGLALCSFNQSDWFDAAHIPVGLEWAGTPLVKLVMNVKPADSGATGLTRLEVAKINVGEYFGEFSFMGEQGAATPAPYDIIAYTKLVLYHLPTKAKAIVEEKFLQALKAEALQKLRWRADVFKKMVQARAVNRTEVVLPTEPGMIAHQPRTPSAVDGKPAVLNLLSSFTPAELGLDPRCMQDPDDHIPQAHLPPYPRASLPKKGPAGLSLDLPQSDDAPPSPASSSPRGTPSTPTPVAPQGDSRQVTNYVKRWWDIQERNRAWNEKVLAGISEGNLPSGGGHGRVATISEGIPEDEESEVDGSPPGSNNQGPVLQQHGLGTSKQTVKPELKMPVAIPEGTMTSLVSAFQNLPTRCHVPTASAEDAMVPNPVLSTSTRLQPDPARGRSASRPGSGIGSSRPGSAAVSAVSGSRPGSASGSAYGMSRPGSAASTPVTTRPGSAVVVHSPQRNTAPGTSKAATEGLAQASIPIVGTLAGSADNDIMLTMFDDVLKDPGAAAARPKSGNDTARSKRIDAATANLQQKSGAATSRHMSGTPTSRPSSGAATTRDLPMSGAATTRSTSGSGSWQTTTSTVFRPADFHTRVVTPSAKARLSPAPDQEPSAAGEKPSGVQEGWSDWGRLEGGASTNRPAAHSTQAMPGRADAATPDGIPARTPGTAAGDEAAAASREEAFMRKLSLMQAQNEYAKLCELGMGAKGQKKVRSEEGAHHGGAAVTLCKEEGRLSGLYGEGYQGGGLRPKASGPAQRTRAAPLSSAQGGRPFVDEQEFDEENESDSQAESVPKVPLQISGESMEFTKPPELLKQTQRAVNPPTFQGRPEEDYVESMSEYYKRFQPKTKSSYALYRQMPDGTLQPVSLPGGARASSSRPSSAVSSVSSHRSIPVTPWDTTEPSTPHTTATANEAELSHSRSSPSLSAPASSEAPKSRRASQDETRRRGAATTSATSSATPTGTTRGKNRAVTVRSEAPSVQGGLSSRASSARSPSLRSKLSSTATLFSASPEAAYLRSVHAGKTVHESQRRSTEIRSAISSWKSQLVSSNSSPRKKPSSATDHAFKPFGNRTPVTSPFERASTARAHLSSPAPSFSHDKQHTFHLFSQVHSDYELPSTGSMPNLHFSGKML